MALTGAALVWRARTIAWADRSVSHVSAIGASRETLDQILDEHDDPRPNLVVVSRDPTAAVQLAAGRGEVTYLNPYTGEAKASQAGKVRAFFEWAEQVHRWLGLQTVSRPVAAQITHLACILFFFLVLSGFYLWFPRNLKVFSFTIRLQPRLKGRAREYNWHTVLGFWALPVLFLSTATGLIMAYPSVGNLFYPIARPAERAGGPGGPEHRAGPAPGAVPKAQKAAPAAKYQTILESAQAAVPNWATVTVGVGGGRNRGGAPNAHPGTVTAIVTTASFWEGPGEQLFLDRATAAVVARERIGDYPIGREIRTLAKPLHTGTAGGIVVQLLLELGAWSTLGLILTGYTMAFRRGRRAP
jgi:uncharacterized iron-regulated membrane protein